MASERRADDARRMELETQLDAFRQQQSEVDRGDAQETETGFGTWVGGKKRRKKDDAGKMGKTGIGVKVRRMGAATKGEVEKVAGDVEVPVQKEEAEERDKKVAPKPPVVPATGLLGLVAYGSDDED